MRRIRLVLIALLLGGCVTASYRSPGEYHGGFLLGSGTYLQDVILETNNGDRFHFQGIFQRRATGVMVTGLSPLGITVFRVKDDLSRGGSPRVEILVKEMELHRPRLEAFYRGMRPLLLLDDKPALPTELVKERWPDRRPKVLSSEPGLELEITEYNWDGRAFRLLLRSEAWKARVSLREYTHE